MSTTPPGWYPDPNGQTRWWDGTQWTESVQPAPAAPTPAAPQPPVGPYGAPQPGASPYSAPQSAQPPHESGFSSPEAQASPYGQAAPAEAPFPQAVNPYGAPGQPGGFGGPVPTAQGSGSRPGLWIGIGLVVLLVVVAGAAAWFFLLRSSDSPEAATKTYLSALRSGDREAACDILAKEVSKGVAQSCDKPGPQIDVNFDEFSIDKVQEQDGYGLATVTVTTKDGEEKWSVFLTKEDDGWKVSWATAGLPDAP